LADEARRQVVAALVLGAASVEELTTMTGLNTRVVATALGRLVSGALVVEVEKGSYQVDRDAFASAARSSRPPRPDEPPDVDGSEDEVKVLRAFVRDGRLVSIPTSRTKRLVILNRLAALFEVGARFDEREVNARLRVWHPDTAALRRYLVDEEFLARDHGEYWRIGGSVDLA
jgi:hypothetical protein